MHTSDDAGVYQLSDESALVHTADFITPPVDDPYLFGAIAATNALNDVYAMGGKPLTALNLVGFPSNMLPLSTLEGILKGAADKVAEADAVLVGGHSTEDEEPKFGLSVTGLVHPKRIWRNSTAQMQDTLILTKPIGSGVLFNANRKGWVSSNAMKTCMEVITTLNKRAAEVLSTFDVHACTDITGFGLAGHGFEMAKGAKVEIHFSLAALPLMEEALTMYKRGMTTGVNHANRALCQHATTFAANTSHPMQEIVFDPQTAGGLLVALPTTQAQAALKALQKAQLPHARVVGVVKKVSAQGALVFA